MRKVILAFFLMILLFSCNDDAPLSKKEILEKYNWRFVSVERVNPDPNDPFPTILIEPYTVTLLEDGSYKEVIPGGDIYLNLGTWTLIDNKTIKLGSKTAVIKKLTESEFIYTLPDRQVRRKSLHK